jgi:predicted nucleic acid-binding protein
MPLKLVVDASVAVKVCLSEPLSGHAVALLKRADVDPAARLFVPCFFYAECANVLWKHVRRFGYSADKAMREILHILRLPLVVHQTTELAEDALDIAIKAEITAYDACYVALARRLGVPLVTADERLVRKFATERAEVLWLGEVRLETEEE